MTTIDISIIAPVYNEEESVSELVQQVKDAMEATKMSWELILVNDGSSDDSAKALKEAKRNCDELFVLTFRRNYGQSAAMQAGIDHAKGGLIAFLDADLQNDPADIPNLLAAMKRDEADVVSGWRVNRKDNGIRVMPSKIANALISKLTGVALHDYGCSLKIYKTSVLKEVRIYGEMHRFIPALVSQFGAKVTELPVNHRSRKYGESKYGLDRTFRVVLDLLVVKFFLKYMHRPMHFFGFIGFFSLIPGFLIGLYLTCSKLFMGADIGGRPLLTLSVLLIMIGVQMIAMGVLAELLVRIYHEPEGRKQYTLKKN